MRRGCPMSGAGVTWSWEAAAEGWDRLNVVFSITVEVHKLNKAALVLRGQRGASPSAGSASPRAARRAPAQEGPSSWK
jgi:hypothetical protein